MNYSSLIKSITGATHRLQEHVATVANQALVIRNWLVGAWLVEFEQNGKDRAKYGLKLLESVAADLAKRKSRASRTQGCCATAACSTASIRRFAGW